MVILFFSVHTSLNNIPAFNNLRFRFLSNVPNDLEIELQEKVFEFINKLSLSAGLGVQLILVWHSSRNYSILFLFLFLGRLQDLFTLGIFMLL